MLLPAACRETPAAKLELPDGVLVAHALGGVDGQTYTNSVEAFEKSYRDGLRWFEVDLQRTADVVAERLEQVDGLRDIRLSMIPGSPEVQVSFDRDKLNRFGLSLAEVSETVRGKVRGTVASRFRDRERHVDIRVQNAADQRNIV